MRLRSHDYRLVGDTLVLRPLTEKDWDALMVWNRDPEVLYFSEGDDVAARSLPEVQTLFRSVSQRALVFLVQLDERPIGDAWLQEMNLPRIRTHFAPDQDLLRIDLTIGDKGPWGRGLGTRVIRLLTRFGFEVQRADALFGCDVADYNRRSLRAFQKNGYRRFQVTPGTPGGKAEEVVDLVLTRQAYEHPQTE